MITHSSYERIEHYLHELKSQARPQAPEFAPNDPSAAQHVQALLALFEENLRELAKPPQPPRR